ncbi:molecular chaperone Hsp33 [Syntrophotalea acetylenivorans]|uniref:33 kDa chaperonin n=1 Tax=Syntrophotalea acetylenivorans TaxID=1842532 RepID=A0A1L3GQV2_9BACT|nr:Hsp33 family molecular chaperone HslO [Syntrophotalea acetylenivorans]APG28285.1 molecular chaperone Hsp33 [Syntrophotalea acetylenivorans]
MKDHLLRVATRDGTLRAAAAVTTDLVEAIRQRQGTDPTATVALGRLVSGAAVMGSLLKGDQRLALMVEGNGPLQKLHAETNATGQLRGSVKEPLSGIAPTAEGFDVPAAVGRAGFLHVVKDLGLKEPYRGMVQLYSSEIAEDLAYYLTSSEQIPSTVALGVYLEEEGRVAAAGGLLVQAMPEGEEALVSLLEERLITLPPLTAMLRAEQGPEQILQLLFEGIPLGTPEMTPLEFRCTCSRPQVQSMLKALGLEELEAIAQKEETTTVTCEFCKERYSFTGKQLNLLLDALKSTNKGPQ